MDGGEGRKAEGGADDCPSSLPSFVIISFSDRHKDFLAAFNDTKDLTGWTEISSILFPSAISDKILFPLLENDAICSTKIGSGNVRNEDAVDNERPGTT